MRARVATAVRSSGAWVSLKRALVSLVAITLGACRVARPTSTARAARAPSRVLAAPSALVRPAPPRQDAPQEACAVLLHAPVARSTAWRARRESDFSRTHAWIATRTVLANDGLAYVDATAQSFVSGRVRAHGWRVDIPVFAGRDALLTWAGVVLPIERVHGPASLAADARWPLARRDHPGFEGSTDFAPRPRAPTTWALLQRAGLHAGAPLGDERAILQRAALAQRLGSGSSAMRSAAAWERAWHTDYLAASLWVTAVHAHRAGDHEVAAVLLRSLAALCREIVPLGLDVPYGPSPSATCFDAHALWIDNERRLSCPTREVPSDDEAARVLRALDREPALIDDEPRPALDRARLANLARDHRALVLRAYVEDERFSRVVSTHLGWSHPGPPRVLRVHELLGRALASATGIDCEHMRGPASIPWPSRAHRAWCATQYAAARSP